MLWGAPPYDQPPTIPPAATRLPGPPGYGAPCRADGEIHDLTLPPPHTTVRRGWTWHLTAPTLHHVHRRRVVAAFAVLGVIVVLVVAGLAAWVT